MLGFYFLFRGSNYAAPGVVVSYVSKYAVSREDLTCMTNKGEVVPLEQLGTRKGEVFEIEIHVRASKGDRYRKGFRRKQSLTGSSEGLCVVTAVVNHIWASRGLPKEAPICAYPSIGAKDQWECITKQDVSLLLKETAGALNEGESRFGTHSLRIGGATAMRRAGIPDSIIQWFGCWKSASSFLRYLANMYGDLEGLAEKMTGAAEDRVYARS